MVVSSGVGPVSMGKGGAKRGHDLLGLAYVLAAPWADCAGDAGGKCSDGEGC